MWPGPYGEWGSRKYLLASLDQSLKRMGLDYVDIFYSHRFDPDTPLEETMGALDTAVRSGRALYAGLSSYNSEKTREAAAILKDLGTPCVIHQPSYNMINRWVERDGLKDTLTGARHRLDRLHPARPGHADGQVPQGHPRGQPRQPGQVAPPRVPQRPRHRQHPQAQRDRRGARPDPRPDGIAWVLRGGGITSALIGASRPSQVEDCVGAVRNLDFTAAELAEIDRYANEEDINLWARSSEAR